MKKLKECCAENKEPNYNPEHIYMCPICQEVYPPKKGKKNE